MSDLWQSVTRWYGERQCARHHHQRPLAWFRYDERPVPITNRATEMIFASGFGRFMKYNGFCRRCGKAVQWSSVDPRTVSERRAARKLVRRRAVSPEAPHA